MRRKELYKIYNEKVKEYMEKGYCIYPYTMAGHQGEICKIDFFKGKEIIRIYMDKNYENVFSNLRCVSIIVGKYTQGDYENETIWMDKLEVIEKIDFYEVDRDKWYVTKDEIEDIKKLKEKRNKYHFWKNYKSEIYTDNKRKEIALKFMKKQPKCKSIKLSDIDSIIKNIDGSGVYYNVFAKDKYYHLK